MKVLTKRRRNASTRLNTRQREQCYLKEAGHPTAVAGCRCALAAELAELGNPALTPALLRAVGILYERLELAKTRARCSPVCAGCGRRKDKGPLAPYLCSRCKRRVPEPLRAAIGASAGAEV